MTASFLPPAVLQAIRHYLDVLELYEANWQSGDQQGMNEIEIARAEVAEALLESLSLPTLPREPYSAMRKRIPL